MNISPGDIVKSYFERQARIASVCAQAEVDNWFNAKKEGNGGENLSPKYAEFTVNEIVDGTVSRFGLPEQYKQEIYDDCIEVASHYVEQPFEEDPNEHLEHLMTNAEQVVNILLEQGSQAEIEYIPVSVDSMPHTTWMIRAVGADPTQYLAKDVAHTPELARQQAHAKARMLGLTITKETNQGQHNANA